MIGRAGALGLVDAEQPEAAIAGRAENGAMGLEQAKGAADMGRVDVWCVTADEQDRAGRGFAEALVEAGGEVASALRAADKVGGPEAAEALLQSAIGGGVEHGLPRAGTITGQAGAQGPGHGHHGDPAGLCRRT